MSDYNPADKFNQPPDGIVLDKCAAAPTRQVLPGGKTCMKKIEIGDFIKIHAWRVEGQVLNVRPGSDNAQEVLLEVKPDDPQPRWYRLEPGEYEVTS